MLEKDKRLFMSQDATVKVREFLAQNEVFKKRTSAMLPLKYSPQKNGWHVTVQSDGVISGGKGFTVEVVRAAYAITYLPFAAFSTEGPRCRSTLKLRCCMNPSALPICRGVRGRHFSSSRQR